MNIDRATSALANMKRKPTAKRASGSLDPVVRCQWIRCTKPAKHKIVRANTCVCDEHLEANILQFGCVFETERVNHGI